MAERYSRVYAEMMQWPILMPVGDGQDVSGVAVDRNVCVVGARALVHLPLPSPQISKAHALLIRDGGGVYVRDLASKNQTFVNDRPVTEASLEQGDVVRFGPLAFTCQFGFSSAAESPSVGAAELLLEPDGLSSRQIVPITQYTFLIGSRHGCDMVLRGAEIGLAHAVIFVREGRRYLRDLSSPGGTRVNGEPIREIELVGGEQILIGKTRIGYRSGEMLPAGNLPLVAEIHKTDLPEPFENNPSVSDSEGEFNLYDLADGNIPTKVSNENALDLSWEDLNVDLGKNDSRHGQPAVHG